MKCVNHSEREAVSICARCGRELCSECVVEINGHLLCKGCVADVAREERGRGGYYRPKLPSKLLYIFLGLLPGLGYMYLGLIKRGLFVMSSFFLTIFLLTQFNSIIFVFLIPIILFASFFDGLKLLRMMREGEVVEDSVSDITGFINTHKTVLLVGAAAVIFFGFFNNILRYSIYLGHGFLRSIVAAAPAIILIGIGIYFFFIRGKKGRYERGHYHKHHLDEDFDQNNEYVDKR